MTETPKANKEAVTAIIVTGIVFVVCILAFTTLMIVFLLNAPW